MPVVTVEEHFDIVPWSSGSVQLLSPMLKGRVELGCPGALNKAFVVRKSGRLTMLLNNHHALDKLRCFWQSG